MPRNFNQTEFADVTVSSFNEAAADAAEFWRRTGEEACCSEASMRPRQMPRNFVAVANLEAVTWQLQ